MRVLKIPVLVTREYPFTISISYQLRILSTNTREYKFFLTFLLMSLSNSHWPENTLIK